jgi:hypothetical protein
MLVGLGLPISTPVSAAGSINYGDINLSGGFQSGHFIDFWDLTTSDITINFTYDGNGLVDDAEAHAWAQLGVRSPCGQDFNPTWMTEGSGVWLSTDYDWTVNTFDPDTTPTLDLDDKLILQKGGGKGEADYNLPSAPPNPGANHRVWWDRDGVDPYQNPETANTGGIYQIVITLHAIDASNGTAYMNIRGLDQGFETDGNWNTIELTPAGITFTGDMEHLQVFYGLYGYGATHSVAFTDIIVDGVTTDPPLSPCCKELIDIKPGSDPNSINLGAKGKVSVAILTTYDFDATNVDAETVTFAGAPAIKWTTEDIDSDGDMDMVLHFKTEQLVLDTNSTSAILQGYTEGGVFFWGEDTVNIVPKEK